MKRVPVLCPRRARASVWSLSWQFLLDGLLEEESKAKFFAALIALNVLLGIGGLCAKNKWGSMAAVLANISLGILLHAVLPRAFAAAFPATGRGGPLPAQDEHEDFKISVRRRVDRVGKFFGETGDTRRAQLGMLSNFILEPLDWLWPSKSCTSATSPILLLCFAQQVLVHAHLVATQRLPMGHLFGFIFSFFDCLATPIVDVGACLSGCLVFAELPQGLAFSFASAPPLAKRL